MDFLGDIGTGHLVLLREIVYNLHAAAPAALVAVSLAATPPDYGTRLTRLIEPAALPTHTIIVEASTRSTASANYPKLQQVKQVSRTLGARPGTVVTS